MSEGNAIGSGNGNAGNLPPPPPAYIPSPYPQPYSPSYQYLNQLAQVQEQRLPSIAEQPSWLDRPEWNDDFDGSNWDDVNDTPGRWTFEVIVGKSNSGKTNLMRERMRAIGPRYHYGIMFCPTAVLSDDYDWMPVRCRYSQWDPIMVWRLVTFLMKMKWERNAASLPPFHAFLLVDDPTGQIDFRKEPHCKLWEFLATKSRHFNLSVFLCVHYYTQLSPIMKANVQRLWILHSNERNYEAMMDIVSGFTKTRWVNFARTMTESYCGLLFDNTATKEDNKFRRTRAPAPGSRRGFRLRFLQ